MFSIKQVADDLGITQQAIYKQRNVLIEKGYMIKNISDKYEVTSKGYQYLKEKRLNKMIGENDKFSKNIKENTDLSTKRDNKWLNEKLISVYEDRINELKEQLEYFRMLYENEKIERLNVYNTYREYLINQKKETSCEEKK